jgi:predicted double-glycine peptidase
MKIKRLFADNNLIIQQKSYTCGPVSLLNVLRLKGDSSYSEDEQAELCEAKQGVGTSHANLVKVARSIGLEVIAEKEQATIADLEQSLDKGHYVIVNYLYLYSDEGHYGLITEYDDEAFYFRDCSYGFIRLHKSDFDNAWWNQKKTIHGWFMAIG